MSSAKNGLFSPAFRGFWGLFIQSAILSDVSNHIKETKPKERPVTYQLTMRGSDGIVIASDRQERFISDPSPGRELNAIVNKVKKIEISGHYAWAYSGQLIAPIFSRHLKMAMDAKEPANDEEAVAVTNEAESSATDEWLKTTSPNGPQGTIVLACGRSGRIFRSMNSRSGATEVFDSCISGNSFNLSAFLPQRLLDRHMLKTVPVEALAYLAAYSIRAAHDLDSAMVSEELDIAIYRDSEPKFEFLDGDFYSSEAGKLDSELIATIARSAPSIREHLKKKGDSDSY